MEKINLILEDMKKTISSKRIGFYLALISSLLALISGIIGNISIYQKQNKLEEDNKHE